MKFMMMIFTRINFLLLFLSNAIASPPFNLSHFIYPKISDEFRPQPSLFLKDVLGAISDSENWELEDVRVSKLEVEKVKYGNLQRYEIDFLLGDKKDFVFNMWDEVSLWKRFKDREGGEFDVLANEVSSRAKLKAIRIEGPFELIVAGDDEMSLMLPRNTSHAGLKRILVGEDITVEVKNAHEIALFQTFDLGQKDGNLMAQKEQYKSWFFPLLTCMPLLPIRVSGSASVIAFRTRNPGAHINWDLLSRDIIELMPEKCCSRHANEKQQCPIESLRSRIKLVEKVLKIFLGDKIDRNGGKLKAKIKASTIFRFQLELERNVRTTTAEWRTRPTVEHVWFKVLARIERQRLKPLVVKKIKPFVGVDSSAWSNLMANISFTKLSSILVAPEALTLDVKW